jgi:hypothetical protein
MGHARFRVRINQIKSNQITVLFFALQQRLLAGLRNFTGPALPAHRAQRPSQGTRRQQLQRARVAPDGDCDLLR